MREKTGSICENKDLTSMIQIISNPFIVFPLMATTCIFAKLQCTKLKLGQVAWLDDKMMTI